MTVLVFITFAKNLALLFTNSNLPIYISFKSIRTDKIEVISESK